MSPFPGYQARLEDIQSALTQARSVQTAAQLAAVTGLILLGVFGYLALQRRTPAWSPVLPIPITLAAVQRYMTNRSAWSRLARLESFYQRGLARIGNRNAGLGFTGEEFHVADHPYARDLDIFGKGSLFELICTARTEIGRHRLSEYLLQVSDASEARARQDAIRELARRPVLREEIALLGEFDFKESSGSIFSEWLSTPAVATAHPVRLLAFASSMGLAFLILGVWAARPAMAQSWLGIAPWIAGLGVINASIAAIFHRRAKSGLKAAARVGFEIGVLRDGLRFVQRQQFESAKLQAIQRELSCDNAAQVFGKLGWMTGALEQCQNPMFELASRALIARTQIWFAVENWKRWYGDSLKTWMRAWGEFEALTALSGYAYEHPDDAYPEFAEDKIVFDARDLGHPLLPADTCVRNDVVLSRECSFYVISGSNMAGKSTLLRAIGLNAALAFAGAPVCAASLRISTVVICASLSIADSVREGKSKFMAEMEKIRQMMGFVRAQKPVLFLIDEMLAGTNSSGTAGLRPKRWSAVWWRTGPLEPCLPTT